LSELTYPQLVRELFPRLTGGVRWGLERTQLLLASVGDPQQSYRTVHVGGTNGKGSVAVTLAAILRATSHPVALYSSPHLCSFRERVQVDQSALTEAAIVDAARQLWPAIRALEPSFFEATTAIALLAFAEAGVEVAVVEVGLGGRLDSTNVIHPELAIITNIAFDHADYLGHTLTAIAWEKAGIIKTGVPLLTAEDKPEILEVFRARTIELDSPLHVLDSSRVTGVTFDNAGTRFTAQWRGRPQTIRTPLIGRHQATNAALAMQAAEVLELDIDVGGIQEALDAVTWPGRLQIEEVGAQTWIFDVAHNVAGVQALTETLHDLDLARPLVLVLGILGDKDWKAMLPPLFDVADQTILTVPPTAPPNRTWDPQLALQYADATQTRVIADFNQALEAAHVQAGTGTVLVTGSFHTVGDALICLNRMPFGRDVALPRVSFAG
jgi:dihydrofolate synthase / folylpolyglutamate synthase